MLARDGSRGIEFHVDVDLNALLTRPPNYDEQLLYQVRPVLPLEHSE
jgi:hypothetical protein